MKTYNKIMELFWLVTGVIATLFVTIMGVKEGFSNWYFYYIFGGMCLGTYLMRRTMRIRMEKHQQFLADKAQENQQAKK
mgnify:CR=1 FL=1|jgi:uncharacterized membrane protein